MAPKKVGLQARTMRYGWLFIAPATVLIIMLAFYPMVEAFIYSLQKGQGNALTFGGYASVAELFQNAESTGEAVNELMYNYIRLFTKDSKFREALYNTFYYLIIQVPIMLVTALVLASLLNNKKLALKGIYRTAIFLPCATSLVSCAIIFKQLFANAGFINTVLIDLNILTEPVKFLTQNSTAKMVIIITMLWRWTGYNMIFYLAGLQNIDPGIYEAAKIDGASAFQRFTKITLPLLKPIILLTTILSTNGTLQLFDEVRNMTAGNYKTMTLSTYIYEMTFEGTPRFGYASAISYVILIMVAVLALIQLKVGESK
ncbi:MAG: carbohydrate ABC transporter permease [Christensenellales bacterium]